MTFLATVVKVLVAGPDDAKAEREAVAVTLFERNAAQTGRDRRVAMPIRWEINSYPALGSHPQTILNKQMVDDCDAVVAIFVEKLGSPTKEYVSGTVEEIERLHAQGKPVLIYFSVAKIDRSKLNDPEIQRLEEFKQSIKERGLYKQYSDVGQLVNLVNLHIGQVLDDVATPPATLAMEEAKRETSRDDWSGELRLIYRRAKKRWDVLRLANPSKIDDAREHLNIVSDEIIDVDIEDAATYPETIQALQTIAVQLKGLSNFTPLTRVSDPTKEFWDAGEQCLKALHAAADSSASIRPLSDAHASALMAQRLMTEARISEPERGMTITDSDSIQIDFRVVNLGQSAATELVVIGRGDFGDTAVAMPGPKKLDPGEEGKFRLRIDRRTQTDGYGYEEYVSLDHKLIIAFKFQDATGHREVDFAFKLQGKNADLTLVPISSP
jgi:hypothetical protein